MLCQVCGLDCLLGKISLLKGLSGIGKRLPRAVVESLFLEVFKRHGCGTCGHGLMVNKVVLGQQLDSMILQVFSNLNNPI